MVCFTSVQLKDFTYSRYFTELSDDEFCEAKDHVLALWAGVLGMWGVLPEPLRTHKRNAIASLLIAWYLADLYPSRLKGGMQSNAGMPVMSKRIGSVSLAFSKPGLPAVYDCLSSNQFGIKAANMLRYAPDMMGVYGNGGDYGEQA